MADFNTEQRFLRLTLSPTIRRHQLRLPAIVTAPTDRTQQPCKNHLPTTMAAAETQQFLRLTLSPTIRRHQLRLPAIVTAPIDQTQHPFKNHLPTTMAAAEMQQASFHRLTHSPTVLQHQLRLHPIKTRRSCPTPFRQPTMAAAETQQESFHRLTHSPTVLQHQLRLHPIKTRPPHPTPFHQPPGFVDELYQFPLPASPIISFTDGKNHFHGFQDAPKTPPASSPTKRNQVAKATKARAAAIFEERFGDLPMPIRCRLMEACKSAMQELVDDVEKEMAAGLNADLPLPEDVRLWREVVAAAEEVGLDVEEPKRKLATAFRLLSPD